jgi:hypothetical protein
MDQPMRSNLFWVDDDQRRQIEPHLPTDVRGKDRVDDRRVDQRHPACAEERMPLEVLPAGVRAAHDVTNKSNRKLPFSFDKKSYRQRHGIESALRSECALPVSRSR